METGKSRKVALTCSDVDILTLNGTGGVGSHTADRSRVNVLAVVGRTEGQVHQLRGEQVFANLPKTGHRGERRPVHLCPGYRGSWRSFGTTGDDGTGIIEENNRRLRLDEKFRSSSFADETVAWQADTEQKKNQRKEGYDKWCSSGDLGKFG